MIASNAQIEELIRIAVLRSADKRLSVYGREQAIETVSALRELLQHRRGVPVEGIVIFNQEVLGGIQ